MGKTIARLQRPQKAADRTPRVPLLPVTLDGIPLLYEDEEECDMGEANLHLLWTEILHVGLKAHLVSQTDLRVYANMNLYYRNSPLHPVTKSRPYVSPDVMVVRPFKALPEAVVSYTIGVDGPAPLLVTEVLSERSAQERDLDKKMDIYAALGVAEYILADPTGQFLRQRLLLKHLLPDRSWMDEQDADGGVTSSLRCRVLLETNNMLRLVHSDTGWEYVRPDEADQRIRQLEAELQQLRRAQNKKQTHSRKKGGQRRKP